MKSVIKKGALVAAATVLSMGAPAKNNAAGANDGHVVKKERVAKSKTRITTGRVLRQEVTDYKKINFDGDIVAYYIDTDNDGMVDVVRYQLVKSNEAIRRPSFLANVQLIETQDEGGTWFISDVALVAHCKEGRHR